MVWEMRHRWGIDVEDQTCGLNEAYLYDLFYHIDFYRWNIEFSDSSRYFKILKWGSGTFWHHRLGAADSAPPFGAGHFGAGTIWRQNFFFRFVFFVATLFLLVGRFARVRIEDSSRNRFALKFLTTFKELPASLFFLHNSKNKNRKNLIFFFFE